MPATHGTSTSDEARTRPRKVRKGTRSCWACRRRKQKCIFDSPRETTCVNCQERDTKCVSQELPEEQETTRSISRNVRLGNRVRRVESLLEKLVDSSVTGRLADNVSAPKSVLSAEEGLITPDSQSRDSQRDVTSTPSVLEPSSKWINISRDLYAALPSRKDLEILCQPGSVGAPSFHAIFTIPYRILRDDGLPSISSFLDVPSPNSHPVVLARYMLRLAIYLQYPRFDLMERQKDACLSEPLSAITERLASVVHGKVTTNDDLTGSIEGLECLVLESQYDLHHGNLRKSWLSNRKTIAVAQLMGLDQANGSKDFVFLDPSTRADPRFMWFRMNLNDRHLCLMLGLAQATHDRSMAEDSAFFQDTPEGQFERLHCVTQSQLLERHESRGHSSPSWTLDEMDTKLQNIAARMPSTWWLLPNFANTTYDPSGLFEGIKRLTLHLNHFHLVLQLHIPFICHPRQDSNDEESKTIAMIASREILSRFLILRTSQNIGFGCRNVDFFALTAALAMILIYLWDHRAPPSTRKRRGHQYLGDRGMMEKAQENMEALGRASNDALSMQIAELLRKLLDIEARAAAGESKCADRVVVDGEQKRGVIEDDSGFSLAVPFFGNIRIAPDGISKDLTTSLLNTSVDVASEAQQTPNHNQSQRAKTSTDSNHMLPSFTECPNGIPTLTQGIGAGLPWDEALTSTHQLPDGSSMGFLAGIDDWAFQGVDTAFFNNLFSGDVDYHG